MTTDITTQILIEIRDQIIATRADLTAELKGVKTELEETKTSLRAEIASMKTELKGEIGSMKTELKGEIGSMKTELKGEIAKTNAKVDILNDKVEAIGRFAKNISRRHEKAIDELRERVAKLEARRKN